MITTRCLLWIAAACVAAAQTELPTASISGTVKDADSGQPLEDYAISTMIQTRNLSVKTDAQGKYRLADLPLGSYRLTVRAPKVLMPRATRTLTLAGNPVEQVDFDLPAMGAISGRVINDAKEPVRNATVFLVAREYYSGGLGYFVKKAVKAGARGEYSLDGLETGRAFLVLAEKREARLPADSEAPADPELRKRVLAAAYYPNSPDAEGGVPIVLRPGETREAVDIVMKRSPSYCVEGTVEASGGPAALRFTLEGQWAKMGASYGGRVFIEPPGGQAPRDGKLRLCDLAPGTYRISAEVQSSQSGEELPQFGFAEVTIGKEDVRKVRVIANPATRLEGEVVWATHEGKPPDGAKLEISVMPARRPGVTGEHTTAHADVPGTFAFPGLFQDEYALRASVKGPGLYVKDVTYGSGSVLRAPLSPGSAMGGAGLKVTVAADGATLTVAVKNKEGVAIGGQRILMMPAQAISEAELGSLLIASETDQAGQFTSPPLAPGKYYVAATADSAYPVPESIGRLWRSRGRFQEVELAPNAAVQVSLEPVKLN